MTKDFPLNISAIKSYGIGKWYDENPIWPVKDFEFDELFTDLAYLYSNTINESDLAIKNSLLALNKLFLGDLLLYLHAVLVTDRLKKSNIHPLGVDKLLYYPYLVNNEKFTSYYDVYRLKVNSSLKRLKLRASQTKRNFSENSDFLSVYQPKKQFISALKQKNFTVINPELIKFDNSKNFEIESFLSEFSNKIANILIKHGLEKAEDRLLRPILKITRDACCSVISFIHNSKKILKKYQQEKILINSLADIKSKCFAIAARQLGKKVYGGMHGNITFITKKTPAVYSDLPVVDTYLLSSKQSGNHLKESYDLLPKKFYDFPKILTFESQYYESIFIDNQKQSSTDTIKKVMILEPPLNDYRFNVHRGHFWYNRLYESIRISKILRDNGFKTIIKRHPDTKSESQSLYDKFFDYQDFGKFEETWPEADAFIFLSLTTTTFGFACTTNRPIVIFSPVLDDCFETPAQLLNLRCRVIKAEHDKYDKLVFSSDELIHQISKPVSNVNNKFSMQFLMDRQNGE